jgi:hypothetical protein
MARRTKLKLKLLSIKPRGIDFYDRCFHPELRPNWSNPGGGGCQKGSELLTRKMAACSALQPDERSQYLVLCTGTCQMPWPYLAAPWTVAFSDSPLAQHWSDYNSRSYLSKLHLVCGWRLTHGFIGKRRCASITYMFVNPVMLNLW